MESHGTLDAQVISRNTGAAPCVSGVIVSPPPQQGPPVAWLKVLLLILQRPRPRSYSMAGICMRSFNAMRSSLGNTQLLRSHMSALMNPPHFNVESTKRFSGLNSSSILFWTSSNFFTPHTWESHFTSATHQSLICNCIWNHPSHKPIMQMK